MSGRLAELQARGHQITAELGALQDAESRSDEQESRVDALLAELNDLGPRLVRERELAGAVARRSEYTDPVGRPAQTGGEGRQVDRRSPGRRFAESDELRAAHRHPKGHSDPVAVGSFFAGRYFGDDEIEQRAVVHSGTAPASMLLPQVVPGVMRGIEPALVMRDVISNSRTDSDTVTFMSEASFTNAAAEVAEATSVSTGLKPESAITFTEQSVYVKTIAHWIPITRQMVQDIPAMQGYVDGRLRIGLERREDNQILNGDGTGANLTGILATSGIQVLDGAYFTASPVANVGAEVENVNRVLRAKTKVATTGQAQATFVCMNPADYEAIQTTSDANRNYLFAGPSSGAAVPTLWGLPVVQSQNITAKTALVGDGTQATLYDRMQAQVLTADQHSDFFTRNLLVLLAEERLALAVYRPTAFVKLTLV